MDVLSLLRSKNRYLRRFEQASLRFLDETENELTHPDFLAAVGRLETTRGRILKALDLFNRELNASIDNLPSSARDTAFIEDARRETDESDRLVSGLLELDSRISARIRSCQDRIALELAASEKSKRIISQFKSSGGGHVSGEGLDQTL
jgi:hypothetical protein